MRQGTRGQGGPATATPNTTRKLIDRELAELERRKMLEIRKGQACLTLEGYRAIVQRFGRGRGRS